MPDNKSLQFTLEQDVKSIITRPSNAMNLKKKGIYEISGLAWSGKGKIARVEVSVDGGNTWADSALEGPIHTKMLTRFRIPWMWDGGPAILQSRAIDEFGRIKPMSWFVFNFVSANCLCNRFSHHSSCVPNGFNGSPLTNRFMLFSAITNSINIRNIGL